MFETADETVLLARSHNDHKEVEVSAPFAADWPKRTVKIEDGWSISHPRFHQAPDGRLLIAIRTLNQVGESAWVTFDISEPDPQSLQIMPTKNSDDLPCEWVNAPNGDPLLIFSTVDEIRIHDASAGLVKTIKAPSFVPTQVRAFPIVRIGKQAYLPVYIEDDRSKKVIVYTLFKEE